MNTVLIMIASIGCVLVVFGIAEMFWQNGEFDKEKCILEKEPPYVEILSREPNNVDAWYQRAIIHYDCGSYTVAQQYFEAVLSLEPDYEQAKQYHEMSTQKIEEIQLEQENLDAGVGSFELAGILFAAVIIPLIYRYYKKKKQKV